MKILGVTIEGVGLCAVVAERTRHAIEIESYYERALPSTTPSSDELRVALHDIIDETQVRDVAMVLNVPDVLITRLPNQERLHGREREQAARLLVESSGFGATVPIKMPTTRDGITYVAVARAERVETLEQIVKDAGGRLLWLDHEAYAWASVLPENAQALVVADHFGAKLIIAGTETVEIGTYVPADFAASGGIGDSIEGKIAAAVLAEIIAAAKANFADVDMIAVDDAGGHYRTALAAALPSSIRIEPFKFAVSPDHTDWALACGVALRALQPAHDRLHVNFFDVRTRIDEFASRTRTFVASGDFLVLALGILVAVGLVGWRSETVKGLHQKAAVLEQQVIRAKREALLIDQDLAKVATARAVLQRVESAQRSAPIMARQVAVIVDRIDRNMTASTLGASNGVWSLTGHATDTMQVAGLMTSLQGTGLDASLTSAAQEGQRLAYAIELDPPIAVPSRATPSVPRGAPR